MERVARLITAAKRLANTASKHGGETLQRWRAVSDTVKSVSNLNSSGNKPQTSHTEGDANTEKFKA